METPPLLVEHTLQGHRAVFSKVEYARTLNSATCPSSIPWVCTLHFYQETREQGCLYVIVNIFYRNNLWHTLLVVHPYPFGIHHSCACKSKSFPLPAPSMLPEGFPWPPESAQPACGADRKHQSELTLCQQHTTSDDWSWWINPLSLSSLT